VEYDNIHFPENASRGPRGWKGNRYTNVRIRHNVQPQPAEWTRMLFTPFRPFMVGTWVPGKLVAPGVVEFERKRIWWDGKKYPDVLVFSKIKHALDGNPVESVEKLGYVYPWSRSHFTQIDPLHGRVRVDVDIAYQPFTNSAIRNRDFFKRET
jgi:hypothetical protein